MNDDIVTRLRNIAALRGNLGGNIIPFACVEAADEIERLNNLLLRCYKLAVGHGPNFEVFDTWEDAISAYENRGKSND